MGINNIYEQTINGGWGGIFYRGGNWVWGI